MERWRIIEEFPGYEISNHGRVRNRDTGHVMSPYLNPNGYLTIKLWSDGKHYPRYIHRLVAQAFVDEGYGPEVNHIDGCKQNNFAENLEWCTRSENARHAIENDLFVPYKLPPRPHESKRVRIVETGEIFDSLTECAERIGGFKTAISACLLGKVRTHKGYHFEEV